MDRNTLQTRMLCIRTLQKDLLAYLYDEQEKKKKEALDTLAIKNQQLLQCDTPSFVYNNIFYGTPFATKANAYVNRTLHSSLIQQVCEILCKPSFDIMAVQAHINHMFSTILTQAQHVDDLRQLLPNAFMHLVRDIDPNVFNIGTPLPDQTIKKIKELVAKNIAYINELCLTRLLLTN